MSRRPKKRNKKYTGEDAKHLQTASSEPVIHHYTAVNRSGLGQWWYEKKKLVRTVALVVGVALLVVWMIIEIINLLT